MPKHNHPILYPTMVIVIFALVVVLTSVRLSPATEIETRHLQAWEDALDSSISSPASSFGIYAYRSAAVQRPEVFLQADALVSETLEDLPGSRLSYRSTDVRDVELYLRLARRQNKGGAFDWGIVSITPDSIFDSKSNSPRSAIDWANLRIPSIAVLLKAATPRLTTLESSLLRFSQLTRTWGRGADIYVVIDRDGVGYLATDTSLCAAGLSNRSVVDWKSVSPVLVFSRQSVFSALTGRDDRAHDTSLATILARLGSPAKLAFNADGRELVSRISQSTAMTDTSALRLAVLIASGLTDHHQPRVANAWSEYAGADSQSVRCATILLKEAYYWGNRLSTISADLANVYQNRPLDEAMKLVQDRYISLAGRRVSRSDSTDLRQEAWGCLWSYDLLQTVIDDNVRTRAGSSSSQASAMSAILDLAGIEHFQLGIKMADKQVPDQEWIFAASGRFQNNFGVWTEIPEGASGGSRSVTLMLSGFTLRGKSVELGTDVLCACFDALAIEEHFSRFTRQVQNANFATTDSAGEVVPLQKFLYGLAENRIPSISPSWP